jgi:hypothetical protein
MSRLFKSICLLSFLLFICSTFVFAEEITITTYYPSPYGSYHELRSQKMAVGTTYINSSAACWASSTCTVNIIPPATDLIVEGSVGIGTIAPLSKLSINGGVHVGGDSDPGDNNLLVDGIVNAAAYRANGAVGLNRTITLPTCNIVVNNGIITGSSCP